MQAPFRNFSAERGGGVCPVLQRLLCFVILLARMFRKIVLTFLAIAAAQTIYFKRIKHIRRPLMTVSMPVSSLTNYNKVLSEVDGGKEVVLTKNGRSKYAVVDIETWQYTTSMLRFLSDMRAVDEEMAKGGKWHTRDEMLQRLGIK
ncbi:MAG: hypothetical protein FWF11_00195 [Coriobacteriia bacterium]|nr:hypothetical protein [Coriobacteriia bacterium]